MELEILAKINGEGRKNILFLHGAYHAAWCWKEHYMDYFYSFGFNVYALSFRNHGKSDRVEDINNITVEEHVEDIVQVMEKINGKVILIAHSMGCKFAQKYLEKNHNNVIKLILLAPMPVRHNLWQLLMIRLKQFGKSKEVVFFSGRLSSEVCVNYLTKLDKESKKVEYAMLKQQDDFDEAVKQIPTLVIGSQNDNCIIKEAVRDNAKLHAAQLLILELVCHDMMLDPDWKVVADKIIEFILK